MSYNKRILPKRGRNKNNFIDNGGTRRSTAESHPISYAAQLRPVVKLPNIEISNAMNVSNFYEDPTTIYLLCKYFMGNFVTIKTDTEELNGVLKAVSPNGDFCLTEATVFTHNVEFISKNEKFKMIPIKDIEVVKVKNVDVDFITNLSEIDKIPTDNEIVKLRRLKHDDKSVYDVNESRDVELTPFYDATALSEDNCLNANKIGAHWFPPEEMFEKNKIRFNVQSSFSEDLEGYTTKLHKDDPNFKKDLMMAHMKAKEIEKDRDHNFNDLENDDETNEEVLFCSVNRSIESPRSAPSISKNKIPEGRSSTRFCELINIEEDSETFGQDLNDPKHNLNPNAREFTPISESGMQYDFGNVAIQLNPLSLQPQGPFVNFLQPTNVMPYPVSVVFPSPHPNQISMMHNPAMDQYLIPRSNFMPNYPMPPFILPNHCQIAFDPNMVPQSVPNCNKYDTNNTYQNLVYPSSNDGLYERECGQNDANNMASEVSTDGSQIKDESSDASKKFGDEISSRGPGNNEQDNSYNGSSIEDHSYECNDSSLNFSKISISSSQAQKMYSQVVSAGNSPTYIFPSPGIRNIGNYPQMIPNQMSYIPNYFSRPPNSIMGPIHQMLPANMIHNAQLPQNLPFQMKQIPPSTNNFQGPYPANPTSFVPILNHQIGGQNFQTTFISGYPSGLSPQINNAQIQFPIHPNMHPQFQPFMTPIQPCNFFAPMPVQPAPLPVMHSQSKPQ